MSRFLTRCLVACSFVSIVSTSAFAEIAPAPHFAQAPHAAMRAPTPDITDGDAPPLLDPVALRDSVRTALVQARARNLAAFQAYQKKGVFPSNTFKDGKLNVWRDQDGHFCAAATIIRASGMTALVDQVAEQNNFIRLADVEQGPVMDWILTSGFTQDEIAMIQEPFMPVVKKPVVEPTDPMVVDARMRARENARLRARYAVVTKTLQRNEKASIDAAVDRLMKHPQLAWHIASAE